MELEATKGGIALNRLASQIEPMNDAVSMLRDHLQFECHFSDAVVKTMTAYKLEEIGAKEALEEVVRVTNAYIVNRR